jgi:hypothetical protein
MSGGSFDYLCFKDAGQLMERQDLLETMADALAKLGYAQDVARETQDLLLDYRAFYSRAQARIERLEAIWRAIEWWYSCDTSEATFKVVLQEWRETHGLIHKEE